MPESAKKRPGKSAPKSDRLDAVRLKVLEAALPNAEVLIHVEPREADGEGVVHEAGLRVRK